MNYRTERDSMGEVQVPEDALYGAQTQRAVENFPLSGILLPRAFIRALGLIKSAAARANADLGMLDVAIADAVIAAADEVAAGQHDDQFPIDVFQTGSGTSTNMNANEVIARAASRKLAGDVHPNDHVNMCQSSNDVIPTAIHVSASLEIHERLLPAIEHLTGITRSRADEFESSVKTGRTHLMDAMPVTLSQELGGWAAQLVHAGERIQSSMPRLLALAIGGTAVGTGINAHENFAANVVRTLSRTGGMPFTVTDDRFAAMSSQDAAVEMSGQLRSLAVALMKISNDLRWMNSGPLAGLGEIQLPALQPGSSIMPGKVNPVIPEAVTMVSAQVMGNDAAIAIGGQSGNFQLNVMLPLIAHNLLQSINLLANAANLLADKAMEGFRVNEERLTGVLARNPILVTALNSVIGYERGAAIAKKAYAEGRPVIDVAVEESGIAEAELRRLLDPKDLTRGGIRK